jgi:branched-chain amino acid transport system substrate-binding protein
VRVKTRPIPVAALLCGANPSPATQPVRGRTQRGVAAAWLLFCLVGLPLSGAVPPPQPDPAAFFRFRQSTLGYRGPSEDFTNLTEIRLGWFGPTNLSDPLHGDLWWAANFALDQANAARSDAGRGTSDFQQLPFRLIARWAVDPWGTGVSQLSRMVYDAQPLALLGSVDSASTHLAEQVVAKAQLPLVSPIATDKTATLAGVSWMLACAPSDAAIARVLVHGLLAALPDQFETRPPESRTRARLALLSTTDHDSRMTTRELLKELSRRGRLPDFRFDVPAGAADVTRQLAALAQARPAAVLIIAGAEDSARLVRALRTAWTTNTVHLSPNAREGAGRAGEGETRCLIFGTHTLGRTRFLDLAGQAAEGVRFPLLFVPDKTDPVTAHFIQQFTRARGHPPDYAAALTYDATRLLIEAIRRAGPNRARIRDALVQLSPWQGIAGPIQFDGTGQNSRTNLCMAIIRGGSIVPLPPASSPNPTTTNSAKP